MIIHFKSEEHRFLSNFYLIEIDYLGIKYPSVEHAYMSAKSDEDVEIDGVRYNWKNFCANSKFKPSKIKGESRFITLVYSWDTLKLDVMYDCLVAKFSNEALRRRLLATGTQNIQEGNWHGDMFWGVDLLSNPNVGENHLGRLLMKVREEISAGKY